MKDKVDKTAISLNKTKTFIRRKSIELSLVFEMFI